MADIDYTDNVEAQGSEPAAENKSFLGAMTNVVGTLVSVGLLVGVGVWGYKLMVRDVSGVPVVRAIEGPMRVQPKNPGGLQADNQGLAVNAVAAQGVAAAPADRLMLAPTPVGLTDEDAPMGEIVSTLEVVAEPSGNMIDEEAVEEFRNGSVEALVNELTAGLAPMDELTEGHEVLGSIVQPEPLDPEEPAALSPTLLGLLESEPTVVVAAVVRGPGPTTSLRPRLRPVHLVQPQSSDDGTSPDIQAAIAAASPTDVDADSLPAGTRLAQLGAYDSPDVARAEWDRMNARFGDYLIGKSRVIQKATSGGRVFYRLRAMGFDDLSDARRFCSALVAENADCIPVTTR